MSYKRHFKERNRRINKVAISKMILEEIKIDINKLEKRINT